MTAKTTLILGATFSMLSVLIGAFGAHALQPLLIENGRLATFETAVQYQIFHSLALLVVGILATKSNAKPLRIAAWLFSLGIVIFSGSLYILSIFNIPIMGAITPFGGVLFIVGWLFVIVGASKMKL